MKIKKYHIYLADLNPRYGTESGKKRPVVVVQTNLLNNIHPSTIICPISTNVIREASSLRVHLKSRENGLKRQSDVLVDQIRAVDNERFIKELGRLSLEQIDKLEENLRIIILE